jgi:hypothetical protein
LARAEKELQQVRKDNKVPTRYITVRREKEEARRKVEEETVKEGQSSKDVRTLRK